MQYDVDTMTVSELSREDLIDSRDLDDLLQDLEELEELTDDQVELLAVLRSIRDDVGSEWKYGECLIHESYFVDYMKDLLSDCGYIPEDFPWWIEINWEQTAENARDDYSSVEIGDTTFYFRA